MGKKEESKDKGPLKDQGTDKPQPESYKELEKKYFQKAICSALGRYTILSRS